VIDARAIPVNERGTSGEPYPPGTLLVYSYSTGLFSSRQIERAG
jgi:hypothetical protein